MIESKMVAVNGQHMEVLLNITHELAHLGGGCDERPLLIFTLAYKDMRDAIKIARLNQEQGNEVILEAAQRISSAVAKIMEEIVERVLDGQAGSEQSPDAMLKALTKPPCDPTLN